MAFVRTFVPAPPAMRDTMALALKHAHPRDAFISFDESTHAYFIFHKESNTFMKVCLSVSGLYKRFFDEFDSERVSLSVAKKRRTDKSSPYYWLLQSYETDEEGALAIQSAWSKTGERAAAFGTKAHLHAELSMNGVLNEPVETLPLPSRAALAWIHKKTTTCGWEPFRTEYSIFMDMKHPTTTDGSLFKHQRYMLAGQVDALFRDTKTHQIHMADWKFTQSEKLDKNSGAYGGRGPPRGKGPLSSVPDNSYGHYLVQQSLYAYMLKKRYDIRIASAMLVHVPTDEENPVAREVPLELLPDEIIEAMFESYIAECDSV
jgi:hypothetical protein